MPVYIFNTTAELSAYIVDNIKLNGNEDITGDHHQDVLMTTIFSLIQITGSIPSTTTSTFDPWDGGTTYDGGVEVIVRHDNKLWLFVSPSDSTGTTPGTNALVWLEISAAQLAHFRNRDQYLDQGGAYEVSAQQVYDLLTSDPNGLAAVLGQSAATEANTVQFDRAYHATEKYIYKTIAGGVELDPSETMAWFILTTVDIDISVSALARNALYTLKFQGAGGPHTVTWPSGWFVADGITLPSSISNGEVYNIVAVQRNFGAPNSQTGNLHVISCAKSVAA